MLGDKVRLSDADDSQPSYFSLERIGQKSHDGRRAMSGPMPIDGIKMSLIHSCPPPPPPLAPLSLILSLSLQNLG